MSNQEDREVSFARVERFVEQFLLENPVYAKRIAAVFREERELFTEIAARMLRLAELSLGQEYPQRLFRGYEFFVTEVNLAQAAYEESGHYRNSSFAEVEAYTYASKEFMDLYHWGVFTSTFAWRHHLNIFRFFKEGFLPLLQARPTGELLDLGCGSGIWTFSALTGVSGWQAVGLDISPTSVDWARSSAEKSALPCRFCVGDATSFRFAGRFQAGISCFLLEHLEEPEALLRNLAQNLEPGAPAFITGAVTAAEVDHIYEFRKESAIAVMAEDSGFMVEKMLSAAPSPYPESRRFKPRSVALILRRRKGELW